MSAISLPSVCHQLANFSHGQWMPMVSDGFRCRLGSLSPPTAFRLRCEASRSAWDGEEQPEPRTPWQLNSRCESDPSRGPGQIARSDPRWDEAESPASSSLPRFNVTSLSRCSSMFIYVHTSSHVSIATFCNHPKWPKWPKWPKVNQKPSRPSSCPSECRSKLHAQHRRPDHVFQQHESLSLGGGCTSLKFLGLRN